MDDFSFEFWKYVMKIDYLNSAEFQDKLSASGHFWVLYVHPAFLIFLPLWSCFITLKQNSWAVFLSKDHANTLSFLAKGGDIHGKRHILGSGVGSKWENFLKWGWGGIIFLWRLLKHFEKSSGLGHPPFLFLIWGQFPIYVPLGGFPIEIQSQISLIITYSLAILTL